MHNEILRICRENGTNEEYNRLMITMESDNGKLDVMQNALARILKNFSKFFKAPNAKQKLYEKSLYDSHGNIDKVKGIETTVGVLEALKKSKDSSVSKEATELLGFYSDIKRNKDSFMKIQSIARNKKTDMFTAQIANLVYWAYTCDVNALIRETSFLAYEAHIDPSERKQGNSTIHRTVQNRIKEYRNGDMIKVMKLILENEKKQVATESLALAIIGIFGVLTLITFALSIRIFVYYFYYTRMQIADHFEQQADFLNIHKAEIKKRTDISAPEKESIIAAQKKWADRFLELSEFFIIDDLKVTRVAEKETKEADTDINPISIGATNQGMDFF